ncbi:sensor histidine kinase [Pseudoclavibacter sp. RFBG4]|uniref:sensor histidine kinase n=1 Tax=Pseudoclavibacter sp. RFBG4 TaxID=2080575 RepID=UPI000CE7C6DE|nr:histidine kinase [Pseudoclavibacter sp. RFBG4]PPG26338.1 sensor histidine kinase [Pseudoclavibacter sp. RFBG4]
MDDSVVVAAVAGLVAGGALSLALFLARRFARDTSGLGGDAEQAAYRALHQASLAAPHLREGVASDRVPRAAQHLRTLLGSSAAAIVSDEGGVIFDTRAPHLEESARQVAERVRSTGRPQVFRQGRHSDAPDAVGAPILVDGTTIGVLVAFSSPVRGALVRVVREAADWCAAQVELGELDTSRSALAEAELRSLRAQISPHFIYNALTAIASFVHVDPDRARELVLDFADFTRYSFRRQGEFTTLADELESIRSYLELERARFGDRLNVTLQIAPETLSTVIPFLSVQPLVENGIRHGLEPVEAGGTLRIASYDAGAHTEIVVEDDGVGMDPETLRSLLTTESKGAHVGLRNVDARLRQVYGEAGSFHVETNIGAGTLVRMRVPKSQSEHNPDLLRAESTT